MQSAVNPNHRLPLSSQLPCLFVGKSLSLSKFHRYLAVLLYIFQVFRRRNDHEVKRPPFGGGSHPLYHHAVGDFCHLICILQQLLIIG